TGYRAMGHRAPFNERPAVVSRNHQVLAHWRNSVEATISLNDTTPAPRGATAGIDWASDNHAVDVLDTEGALIERKSLTHTAAAPTWSPTASRSPTSCAHT